MTRPPNEDAIEVHDGIYIRRTGKKGIYQCYFRLDGRSFRESTKKRDLAEAKMVALQMYQEARNRQVAGQPVARVPFKKLREDYVASITGSSKAGYHTATINRHIAPFFDRFDDVSKITTSSVIDYLQHRNGKGAKPPAPQTLNRENTVLRQLLAHGVRRKWLSDLPEIRFEAERLTRRRRRHFTTEEYRKLHRTSRKRARELRDQPLHTMAHWSRLLLHDYIMLLANTGMRVDESRSLTWRNIDFDHSTILLERAGKLKSTRRVIPRKSAMDALQRIRDRREGYLAERGGKLLMNEPVLSLPNGKSVGSMKTAFGALLDACGFVYQRPEDRHSLTSLRHSYATFRLTTKSGKRASMRALAQQMGTSERMIQQHYGHDVIEDYRDELVG